MATDTKRPTNASQQKEIAELKERVCSLEIRLEEVERIAKSALALAKRFK